MTPGDFIQFGEDAYGWYCTTKGKRVVICDLDVPISQAEIILNEQIVKYVTFVKRSDVVWALWKLYFGFKVRRSSWPEDMWADLRKGHMTDQGTFEAEHLAHKGVGVFQLGYQDLIATDWEVYGADPVQT